MASEGKTSQYSHKAHTICINSTYSLFMFDEMIKEEAINARVSPCCSSTPNAWCDNERLFTTIHFGFGGGNDSFDVWIDCKEVG